jgi:hypothetical protein
MRIDIMEDRNVWIEVIHLLFLDQGLDTPTSFEWEHSDNLLIAARFLRSLSNKELINFCIGDQVDMDLILKNAEDKEGSEAAHQIVDDLFNNINGYDNPKEENAEAEAERSWHDKHGEPGDTNGTE